MFESCIQCEGLRAVRKTTQCWRIPKVVVSAGTGINLANSQASCVGNNSTVCYTQRGGSLPDERCFACANICGVRCKTSGVVDVGAVNDAFLHGFVEYQGSRAVWNTRGVGTLPCVRLVAGAGVN